jgi:hypothetical protein
MRPRDAPLATLSTMMERITSARTMITIRNSMRQTIATKPWNTRAESSTREDAVKTNLTARPNAKAWRTKMAHSHPGFTGPPSWIVVPSMMPAIRERAKLLRAHLLVGDKATRTAPVINPNAASASSGPKRTAARMVRTPSPATPLSRTLLISGRTELGVEGGEGGV